MKIFHRTVCVSDTDCTKALYFTNLLKFTQEALEQLLKDSYPELVKKFHEGKIALPIVHAEANFIAPIFLGDELKISLTLEFRNSSFLVSSDILFCDQLKGKCKIRHVCLDLITKEKLLCADLFQQTATVE